MKILFMADTHLGFDLPLRPRIERRRRGHDFFKNYEKALEPALNGQVHCVVHGGDLFFRSKIPAAIVEMAFEPLKRVADLDIPVYIVPGNHERSKIPHRRLAEHPFIHIFDEPATFLLETEKGKLAFSGFPFVRRNIRHIFREILGQTGWKNVKADARILCVHQAFEGATVGTHNYTFRDSNDVVRVKDIPEDFLAVFAGHIHRAQWLKRNLMGNPSVTPIFYSGSIEKTSFAERGEAKGFYIFDIEMGSSRQGRLGHWKFHELGSRPMIRKEIMVSDMTVDELKHRMKAYFEAIPADSIVEFRVTGMVPEYLLPLFRAPMLRKLAPFSMNVTATFSDYRREYRKRK